METIKNPKNYSNSDLNERLKFLVNSERKITREILELINLVELRKLHLQMSYSSVFDYLTKYLGYNESAAYRRMQAARLLRDCPEMTEPLQSGKLHLTQMAQMQTAIKAQQKHNHQTIDKQTKLNLLKELENKTSTETQKILVREFTAYESKTSTNPVQHKKDETVYLTLHLRKEQFEYLMQTKDLMSHVSNGKVEDIIERLCKKEIHRRTKGIKRDLFKVSSCCQYKDPITGKKCGSKFQLQLDHIKPRWAGGENDKSNLQILCAAHNRFKYQQEAGISTG